MAAPTATLTVVPDPAPRVLDLDVMTAPTTTDELTEALARAETVEAVSNIHNTVRRGGLFGADELWTACAARWAEIEQGMTRERTLDS